ncbi:acyl carrier protein [Erwinia mallotivora]|uniref:Type III secretion system protein n=1 Tax=Erwinia mallotivora TaxID=69222 RepID=A0A014MF43_9GAMM|nr:acyl carrier protein [Erwinia mallotivora]EXU76684.1 type III secretion system protein [Erwinia mallotivora]
MNSAHNQQQAFSLICQLIQGVNGTPANQIGLHDSLITDLAMDSVELIDLLMQLEGHGVVIEESEITPTLTVACLVRHFMSATEA